MKANKRNEGDVSNKAKSNNSPIFSRLTENARTSKLSLFLFPFFRPSTILFPRRNIFHHRPSDWSRPGRFAMIMRHTCVHSCHGLPNQNVLPRATEPDFLLHHSELPVSTRNLLLSWPLIDFCFLRRNGFCNTSTCWGWNTLKAIPESFMYWLSDLMAYYTISRYLCSLTVNSFCFLRRNCFCNTTTCSWGNTLNLPLSENQRKILRWYSKSGLVYLKHLGGCIIYKLKYEVQAINTLLL